LFTFPSIFTEETLMNLRFGRGSFYLSVLCAFTAVLFSSTLAHGQAFYSYDWTESFNNSATSSDTEDNWVANSYTASSAGVKIVSITIPIRDTFTDQPISALIYQGFDLLDPTAGGGLILMARQDTTITTRLGYGDIVTVTFENPVTLNPGDIFYAAILIPGVPGGKFPFRNDTGRYTGRSFFDVGLTFGGPYDINQLPDNSFNITPLGGTHPVLGPGIQGAGILSLWVNGLPAN
jgi:hypothetical protein